MPSDRCPHDSDYCAQRASQARADAYHRWDSETVRISGDLALAYAALAIQRRQSAPKAPPGGGDLKSRRTGGGTRRASR